MREYVTSAQRYMLSTIEMFTSNSSGVVECYYKCERF